MPFTGADEDEVEAAVRSTRWKFDPKAFASITADAKNFITGLINKVPRYCATVDQYTHHFFPFS